jgi:hypothetical protein
MSERTNTWEPVADIDFPCADISFSFGAKGFLRVLMHFSRVKNGHGQDLELLFSGAIGLHWTPEHLGFTVKPAMTPKPLPKISAGQWSGWTHPLLTVGESSWLASYQTFPGQTFPGTERRQHFSLISMNDLLDIIAFPEVAAQWLSSNEV